MNRKVIAVLVLAGWLGIMGWMVRREYFRPRAELLAEAALNVAPGATYYSLELSGQQIGFASSSVDTLQDTVRVQDQMLLRIPAMGTIQRVRATTTIYLTRTLQLRSFDASLRGDDVRFDVRGAVEGDVLAVEIESADSKQDYEFPLDEPIMLPALLPLSLAFGEELAIGNTYSVNLFDPLQLADREVDITIVAESTFIVPDSATIPEGDSLWVPARWDTLHAWKVRQTTGGFEVESWIDDVGHVVEASSPMGFSMRRTAYEIAFLNFTNYEPEFTALNLGADLIRQTAIASNVDLETENLSRVDVLLRGVNLSAFDLSGGRQQLVGDTLRITREDSTLLNSGWRLPSARPDLAEYLQPEPLVQSDDPRIEAQARLIAGRERHPEHLAEQLVEWVYDALDKRITVSVPSAVEVLETKRGDCNEHTVLYVALARAAGLPARTAAGLVYMDGRFYYHAWPEVWLNDAWVAVDPTLNQFPADAAHLRFTIGGLARQVELIQLIGRLELDVLRTEANQ
jgi:transglutaminase-like putative cysteine protease